jgi:hypothetical protein
MSKGLHATKTGEIVFVTPLAGTISLTVSLAVYQARRREVVPRRRTIRRLRNRNGGGPRRWSHLHSSSSSWLPGILRILHLRGAGFISWGEVKVVISPAATM